MENVKEYVVFHETKWDDIHDKKGNVVLPRTNQYWLEGFWGIDDCKEWVAEGNKKGAKTGAVTLENIFAVCKDNLVPFESFEPCAGETIIVCVKTSENAHKWKEALTMIDATNFVKSFHNITEVLVCSVFDIEFIE